MNGSTGNQIHSDTTAVQEEGGVNTKKEDVKNEEITFFNREGEGEDKSEDMVDGFVNVTQCLSSVPSFITAEIEGNWLDISLT